MGSPASKTADQEFEPLRPCQFFNNINSLEKIRHREYPEFRLDSLRALERFC